LNIFAYKGPRGREHGDVDGKEEEGEGRGGHGGARVIGKAWD